MTLKSFLVAANLSLAANVHAQTPADAYDAIGNNFLQLVFKAGATRNPSVATDAQARKLTLQLSDEARFLKFAPNAPETLPQLTRICAKTHQAMLAMTVSGGQFTIVSHPDLTAFEMQEVPRVVRNIHDFGAPLAGLEPFAFHCLALSTQALQAAAPADTAAYVNNTAYKSALMQTQHASIWLYMVMLQMMAERDIDPTWLAHSLQAAAETAPVLPQLLPLKLRGRLRELVEVRLAGAAPQAVPQLTALRDAFAKTECGSLCRLK